MIKLIQKLLTLVLTCLPVFGFSQQFLNLDFEHQIPGTQLPQKWRISTNGYKIELDTHEKFSATKSLKITSLQPSVTQAGACAISFPVELVKGKNITLKGRIKTQALTGQARFFLRADGVNGNFKLDDMAKQGLSGSQDWTTVSLKIEVPENPIEVNFGAIVTGEGTAWFDNFEVWINEAKFPDGQPRLTEPTAEELSWLRKYIYPLKTVEPGTMGNEDLKILKKLVGDAKVVALGEVSHGSREIFKMKHRLVQYLVENEQFNIFSMEASMPESYRLNEYIVENKVNAPDLIKNMNFWAWRTQEVLKMVEWMKIHNQSKPKFQFTGFDMQSYFGPLKELELAFQVHQDVLLNITKLKKEFVAITDQTNTSLLSNVSPKKIKNIKNSIFSIDQSILTAGLPDSSKEWLLQNTRILEQFLANNYLNRDKFMAENLIWIKAHNPKSKIVVWAHNEHIRKNKDKMGQFIADSLGKEYVTIGFSFHQGKYTAKGDKGITSYSVQDSYLGTYEYFFNALQEPYFILDLRKAKQDSSEHGKWLRQSLGFRSVGAVKMENEFTDTILPDDFDFLIFINESTPSILLD